MLSNLFLGSPSCFDTMLDRKVPARMFTRRTDKDAEGAKAAGPVRQNLQPDRTSLALKH
jgi:hypothetical protein